MISGLEFGIAITSLVGAEILLFCGVVKTGRESCFVGGSKAFGNKPARRFALTSCLLAGIGVSFLTDSGIRQTKNTACEIENSIPNNQKISFFLPHTSMPHESCHRLN